jgi:2',5'-phosphodiesterase
VASTAAASTSTAGLPTAPPSPAGPEGWEAIPGATQPLYTPTPDDVGWLLRCAVTPGSVKSGGVESGGGGSGENATTPTPPSYRLGTPAAADASLPVAPGPPSGPGAGRHAHTPHPLAAPRVRIVTYNLLADQYASSDYAKAHLFAHCHPHFLDPAYRRALAAAELLGYHADVICLQEVDERAFTLVLGPALRAAGYAGVYTNKASAVREGCATFWRADRWALVARRDVALKDVFAAVGAAAGLEGSDSSRPRPADAPADRGACAALAARHAALAPALASSPALRSALAQVSTIGQVSLLVPRATARPAPNPDGPLLVANTHLFFHPRAPHIRTLHLAALVTEAWDVAARAAAGVAEPEPTGDIFAGAPGEAVCDAPAGLVCDPAGPPGVGSDSHGLCGPALVLAGDLNSDLNDGIPGAVELLREGRLPSGFWDWAYGAGFRYEADGVDAPATAVAAAQAAAAAGEAPPFDPDAGPPSPTAPGLPPPPPSATDGFTPPDLALPLRLRPADGLRSPFTNFVRGYTGLLDYVWADLAKLSFKRWVPLPRAADLPDFLPSQAWPSDHLAVVVDLEWRAPGVRGGACPPSAVPLPPEWRWTPPAGLEGGGGENDDGWASGDDDVGPPPPVRPAGTLIRVDDTPAGPAADPAAWDAAVAAAVLSLRRGELVALPTDTLYGLAADACSASGVRRAYRAKGRPSGIPLAVAVGGVEDVGRVGDVTSLPPGLVPALLPGPVTLVLRRLPTAPLCADLNPGVATIGVRVPASPFVRAVAAAHGGPLALTSANLSGAPSSVEVGEFAGLWLRCAAVFEAAGGRMGEDRAGSTVVDVSEAGLFRILREGAGVEAVRGVMTEHGLREAV